MKNLCDINVIKDVMTRHGFNFSKALGQNFIVNPSVCPRIAEMGGVDENTGVIEIVNEDVLKVDLHKLIEEKFAGMRVVVCANLPYYITSPIIMMLLESNLPIESVTVMVQKEAGDRLCAKVGARDAGAVTVAVDYYACATKLFDVSRGSFMPSPKVDSMVIKLELRQEKMFELSDEKKFFRLVKAAFGQRRKTASNSISSGMGLPKADVIAALERAGFDANVRAEKFTMEDFRRLCEEIQ